jgi:hypothetical protein
MTYAHTKDLEQGDVRRNTDDTSISKDFIPPHQHSLSKQQESEEFHGFLSRQFPQIANPAPLGLGGFALTTFVLSMFNAGAIVGK